ncbi:MAG: acyl-[acyl-carrier-protein]-phospholipid O-acyltransferase [Halieaceae bacterium]|jgi:acyl-[acyl-carrier-protein]-phospholipid O-acyltransferase/long-chain-fatty-acid--[acyl-carrier-protein] ligase
MRALKSISGFLPYIIIVFLNAFVDLGHKITIQNTVFKIYDGQTQIILTAIVNALILIPFILLFSPSGFLADKYPKHLIIRYGAMAAVVATLLITFCYYQGWFWAAFSLTLALAIQSAVYSPAKYGYIKELVGKEKLAPANGVVQAVTISGILLGTFVFSGLFEAFLRNQEITGSTVIMTSVAPVGWVLVVLALCELALCYRLPAKRSTDQDMRFVREDYFRLRYLQRNLAAIRARPVIWLSIVGLATFWGISQVLLAAFPAFAKETLNETNTLVIQGILACSGIGIITGSLIAGRMSRNYIETGLIPIGAVGIALLITVIPSLETAGTMAVAFVVLGMAGGMFIIPLNSLIQFHAEEQHLGTVLAGNNWVQNVTMLSFLTMTALFAVSGIGSVGLFYILTLAAIIGTGYTVYKLPHSLARLIASAILKRRYHIEVVGFANLPPQGPVLLLGNHISWIDWALVQIACPRPVRFVMQRQIYETWYLKPFFKVFGVIPIASGQSKESLQAINNLLKQGEVVCLFPEGAISRNGHLGKFHSGFERTIEGVEKGVIVPFYLRGLWGSTFSRASEGLQYARTSTQRRDIIVAFGQKLPMSTAVDTLKQKVFELSISAWENYTETLPPVPLAWFITAKRQPGLLCTADATGNELSHQRTLAATFCFARAMRKIDHSTANVGIMLPASSAAAIANMAVMLNGKAAANLNFTANIEAVQASIASAELKVVYTSREFKSRLETRGIDLDALLANVQIEYMEDIRSRLPSWRLALALVQAILLPARWLYRLHGTKVDISQPAAILFSSGSEGLPKGVVLSHRNIVANCKQISDVLNTRDDDIIMGTLPPFHCFGLTVTTLMPMVEGIPVIFHPDPREVLVIAKAIARYRATLLCGTATFLRLYSRNKRVESLMLDSLRIVVSGAEKLTDSVRNEFQLKFNKTIYEGYGTTETTPVASCNIPDAIDTNYWHVQYGNRPGTVGMPLPGTCFRIVDPETMVELPLGEDGLIMISGNQVMLGYLNDEERTARAIVEIDGRRWYKTGDKGHVTPEGFLAIVDRYSRFAKIGGEMVGLGRVEAFVRKLILDEETEVAAVSMPDHRKGERIVLLVAGSTNYGTLRSELIAAKMDPLLLPSQVLPVAEIPKLGSGKTDFGALARLAKNTITRA